MSAFYAELLPNIRSISLLVSLATPAGHSTHVALNPASASATLHHNANSTSLALPAPANPGPLQLIVKATPGSSALSCRLPLASASPPAPASDNYAPWSAPSLSALSPSSVSFYCRGCGAEVIAPGCINTWKDLPSGNWADMMDFWHCHKPHDDGKKGADQEGVGKYAAFGKGFVVERGTGLVDRGHFLFSSRDCEGAVKVSLMLLVVVNETPFLHPRRAVAATKTPSSAAAENGATRRCPTARYGCFLIGCGTDTIAPDQTLAGAGLRVPDGPGPAVSSCPRTLMDSQLGPAGTRDLHPNPGIRLWLIPIVDLIPQTSSVSTRCL